MTSASSRTSTAVRWFVASRLVIVFLGALGVAFLTDQHAGSVGGIGTALDLKATWNKWDAVWYERVATHGYTFELDTKKGQAAAGYFPLYPMTIRLILSVAPSLSFFWVAVVISNLATLLAFVLLARELVPRDDLVGRVMAVMALSAASFYLSIPYTEGVFLLCVVGTMVATRHRRYELAGLIAGLAAVTRIHGLALIAVPAFACLLDATAPSSRRWTRTALTIAIFAVPFAIYMAYQAQVLGSPIAFLQRQEMWQNPAPYPFRAIVGLYDYPKRINGWIHGFTWFLYVGLLIRYWRRLPIGEALFCAGVLFISTQQDMFQGIYRYVMPLVPLTLAIAQDRDNIRKGVIAFNVVLGVVMLLWFVTNNRLVV